MRKPLLLLVGVLGVVLAAGVLWNVLRRGDSGDVVVGAVLPLTADAAEYGDNARKAIALAVEEINSAGGVRGRKVAVIYEDTKAQAKDAVAAVTKLTSVDNVRALIGPMSSSEVEAVLPICEKCKVILLSPSATDHKLSGASKYFFRTIVSDIHEGKVMADFAFKDRSYRRVAILYMQSAGPFGVSETFRKEFEKLGGTITTIEKTVQNASDMRAQLTRIKESKADALFIAGFAKETATMLKQAKELGLDIPILAHGTAEAPEVRQLAGSAAEGVVFASSTIDPKQGGESVRRFHEEFKRKYGSDPQNYAPNAYDAMKLLAQAMEKRGFDSDNVIGGLREIRDYRGAAGQLTIEDNGDVTMPMRIMVIREGTVVPVENATAGPAKKSG